MVLKMLFVTGLALMLQHEIQVEFGGRGGDALGIAMGI